MDRDRIGSVAFFAAFVAAGAAFGAWGYWGHRESELRNAESADALVRAVGGSGGAIEGPSVAPFWILVGVAVVAALVSVAMGVGLWITPKPETP